MFCWVVLIKDQSPVVQVASLSRPNYSTAAKNIMRHVAVTRAVDGPVAQCHPLVNRKDEFRQEKLWTFIQQVSSG